MMQPKPLEKKDILHLVFYVNGSPHDRTLPSVAVITLQAACEWYLKHKSTIDGGDVDHVPNEIWKEWREYVKNGGNGFYDYDDWLFRKAFAGVLE